jgi:quercetin dioxygenase-like cupin family protein
VLTVTTSSIPKADTQEARNLTATLPPGAASTWHTHPSSPFAYVIEGTVVIESETRPPIEVRTGHAIAEPTGEVIRAVNRGTVPAKLVIFYVAPPRTPFLEEVRR